MSIRPDVLALPRRYLWLMYHESITQSQVGVELLGQLKLHRKKDILHLYQDLQHFSFGRASGLGKRSLHLWCIQTRRNYFKISNEAKREYSEGFVLQHFYFWKKKSNKYFDPTTYGWSLLPRWLSIGWLCKNCVKPWWNFGGADLFSSERKISTFSGHPWSTVFAPSARTWGIF